MYAYMSAAVYKHVDDVAVLLALQAQLHQLLERVHVILSECKKGHIKGQESVLKHGGHNEAIETNLGAKQHAKYRAAQVCVHSLCLSESYIHM